MHDHRVRGGNVEAGFDDVGGKQQIVAAVIERTHHRLELGRRHLAVRHRHFYFRHQFLELLARVAEIADARRHIENLAAAVMLAQDRLANDDAVIRHDEGAHGEAVRGGRRDDAHLAHA